MAKGSKDRLCNAMELLNAMAEAYFDLEVGQDALAETKIRPLYTALTVHLRGNGEPPASLHKPMADAKKLYGQGHYLQAVDTIKDQIHRNKAARDFFLGSQTYSPRVKRAVSEMGKDVSNAIDLLDNLNQKTSCGVIARKKGKLTQTMYWHELAKGT